MLHAFSSAIVLALLPQGGDVPTVLHLGPRPDVPMLTLPLAAAAEVPRAEAVMLAAAPETPWSEVEAVLQRLRAAEVRRVHFAAVLPDGTAGAVGLSLPLVPDVGVVAVLRAHRQRPGVPVESATLLLRRVLTDLSPEAAGSCTLGLELPADVAFGQALRLFAACVAGGAQRVVLQVGPRSGSADARAALALDLEGPLAVQVTAQQQVASRPALRAEPFGAFSVPPPVAKQAVLGGGAGGRYGGRGGGLRAAGMEEALTRSLAWLARQVGEDGACRADGVATGEATALVALALLASGSQLVDGPHRDALQRCIGWLVANQRADGAIGAGEVTPRAQALACLALVEAYGLSSELHARLLRGSLVDGMQFLWQQRSEGGGFGPGPAGDAATTAHVVVLLASAQLFRVPTPAHATDLLASIPATDVVGARAADAFARCFAEPGPISQAAAQPFSAGGELADAEACFWCAQAVQQAGGPAFARWQKAVAQALVAKQVVEGGDAGTFTVDATEPRLVATAWWTMALLARVRYSRLVR